MRRIDRIVALLLLLAACRVEAQEPEIRRLLGVGLEGGLSFERGELPIYAGSADCGLYEKGNGGTFAVGVEYGAPSSIGPLLGYGLRLQIISESRRLSASPRDPQRVRDPTGGGLVEVERELSLSAERLGLRLEFPVRFDLGRWGWELFPWGDVAVTSTTSAEDRLADGYLFDDGRGVRPLAGGSRPDARPITAGIGGGFSVALDAGGDWRILPLLRGRLALTSLVADGGWRSLGISAGVTLARLSRREAVPPAPTPTAAVASEEPPPLPSRPPPPALTLRLETVDTLGHPAPPRLLLLERIERDAMPLVPVLFFPQGDSVLPERFATTPFSREADLLVVQQHVAATVIERMTRDRSISVTLHGSTSSEEPRRLALARARAIARLLVAAGVERRRITVSGDGGGRARATEATEDGRQENRCVAITTSSPALLEPVVVERRSLGVDAPRLLSRTYDSSAGGTIFREWGLALLRVDRTGGEDQVVERHRGTGRPPAALLMRTRLDTLAQRLDRDVKVAAFRLEATIDGRTHASEPVELTLERQVEIRRGGRGGDEEGSLRYVLAGFDYDSDEPGPTNRALLRTIARVVPQGGRIVVTGYTDRIGSRAENDELAMRRATMVAQLLKQTLADDNVRVEAVSGGVDARRFPNDLPEGRLLSRGAVVRIDRPE